MRGVQQICTFFVENQVFGVPVSQVQEVIRFQAITPVPLSPVVVEGMINLRGQIVIAIDLRRRLGLSPRTSGNPMNVIVRTVAGAVSLLVDKIGDVVEVDESSFEPPPRNRLVGRPPTDHRNLQARNELVACARYRESVPGTGRDNVIS
jgi:purine-binding chemotaxis protein CheW